MLPENLLEPLLHNLYHVSTKNCLNRFEVSAEVGFQSLYRVADVCCSMFDVDCGFLSELIHIARGPSF